MAVVVGWRVGTGKGSSLAPSDLGRFLCNLLLLAHSLWPRAQGFSLPMWLFFVFPKAKCPNCICS